MTIVLAVLIVNPKSAQPSAKRSMLLCMSSSATVFRAQSSAKSKSWTVVVDTRVGACTRRLLRSLLLLLLLLLLIIIIIINLFSTVSMSSECHDQCQVVPFQLNQLLHGKSSLNNLCDLPEFCEIQLCLPEDRLPSPATTSLSSPATDDPETPSKSESPLGGGSGHCRSPVVSMCIPRQAVCLIRIKGRVLTVYTYNWLRDELDRLMGRVETLVDWYNQRFQVHTKVFLKFFFAGGPIDNLKPPCNRVMR
ncbi:unnamed protein product [Schistocephalus solidus]|uniref:Uncharacterized protein n=1 Tax=Schistocephalus solidus TaxID=70667 RepID=A0A183TSV7_SCHSO|nr:unnamed protein product [Schistocephalus solidus]